MDDVPSTSAPQSMPGRTPSSPWIWLMASLVATTAVSLAAAHAPPRVRLIGLFSIAFGLLVGWMVVRLADLSDVCPSRQIVSIAAAILALGGLVGNTWETSRLDQLRTGDPAKERMAEQLIEQMKTQPVTGNPIPYDLSKLSAFRWHLSRRIRQLGRWPSPWPEYFWLAELLTASAASVWFSNRLWRKHANEPSLNPSGKSTV